jgi:hypothetical protein
MKLPTETEMKIESLRTKMILMTTLLMTTDSSTHSRERVIFLKLAPAPEMTLTMTLEHMNIKKQEGMLHHIPPAVTSLLSGMRTISCQAPTLPFQEMSMTFRETVHLLKLESETISIMILELMLIKRLEVMLHHTPPAETSLHSGMKTTLCQEPTSQFQETSMTFRETVPLPKMTSTVISVLTSIKRPETTLPHMVLLILIT